MAPYHRKIWCWQRRKQGWQALAITDHDTIAGWDEAIATAQSLSESTETPMEIIPGVELSVTENGRSIHILGFYPDPVALRPLLTERLAGRRPTSGANDQKN